MDQTKSQTHINSRMTSAEGSVESLDSTGKKKSFGRIMERFAEKTSMQGVPYINSAKLKKAKVAWAILLIVFIGAMVFHLTYLCIQFFEWPKSSKITLGFSNLDMPAITICNVNIVRNSKLRLASQEMQDLVTAVDPSGLDPKVPGSDNPTTVPTATNPPVGKRRRKRFVDDFDKLNLSRYDENNDVDDLYDDPSLGEEDTVAEIENLFESLYMEMDRDIRVEIGHQIEHMLVSCSFDGRVCDASEFRLFQTSKYGNCYTIQNNKFKSKEAGPSSGLSLILYMGNTDYLKGITQGYGARITIHGRDTIPYPDTQGFFVSTTYETEIALKYQYIKRLGSPYGKCDEGLGFKTIYKRNYTRKACQEMCEHTKIKQECGCYSEVIQEILSFTNLDGSTKICRSRKDLLCEAKVQNQLRSKTVSCVCNNPCSEVQYKKTLSSRQWPTDEYSTALIQSICDNENRTEECDHLLKINDKRSLSSNFLKVVIYYEDLNYEEIIEKEEIENAQFASDVGGAIGLWIGLSMLSIFEVFQLLCELCDFGASKVRRSKRDKERRKRKKQQAREKKARENAYRNDKGFSNIHIQDEGNHIKDFESTNGSTTRGDYISSNNIQPYGNAYNPSHTYDEPEQRRYWEPYGESSEYKIYTGKPLDTPKY